MQLRSIQLNKLNDKSYLGKSLSKHYNFIESFTSNKVQSYKSDKKRKTSVRKTSITFRRKLNPLDTYLSKNSSYFSPFGYLYSKHLHL